MSNINLPIWVPILAGSGLVGFLTFLVKQITDQKDERISGLRDTLNFKEENNQKVMELVKKQHDLEIINLERKNEILEDELKEIKKFREILSKLQNQDSTDSFRSGEVISSITKHLKALQEYSTVESQCYVTAKWIESRRVDWLSDIIKLCVTKYPAELEGKEEIFYNDISECISWLHDSIFYNIDHKLSDYLPSRSLNSVLPYRYFFKELKNRNDIADLNLKEADIMREYINTLIDLL